MRWIFVAGLAGLAVLAAGAWLSGWLDGAAPRADPNDAAQVALGQSVYAEHCASCHGARLQGEANWRERKPDGRLPAPPHDETGHTWHHPDAQLFALTKDGVEAHAPEGYRSDMPGFADILGDEEIWAVIAFIKSRWPERERAYQTRIDEAYRRQGSGD